MPITRTPIINDDLSGTTGTILDNAWKQELYNQIDAADAASLLYKAGGSNTATGATGLGDCLVPALGANDSLKVILQISQSGAGGLLNLATAGALLVRLDDIGSGISIANNYGLWEVTIRQLPGQPTTYHLNAAGGTNGSAGGIRTAAGANTGANWTSGGWHLFGYSQSQAAGGTQLWSMTVWKV